MNILKTHIIPQDVDEVPVFRYIHKAMEEFPTLSSVKKAISRQVIIINGKKTDWNMMAEPGMEITIIEKNEKSIKPLEMELEIIFEDEYLAVINKPAGIEVSGNKYFTIQNALVYNIKKSEKDDALIYPRPAHRLDFHTSGLLIVAKTRSTLAKLGHQFEKRKVKKTYLALVAGRLEDDKDINIPVGGLESHTQIKILSHTRSIKTGWITQVQLYPKTGRKHQLRIHMAESGYPIMGDRLYGNGPVLKGKGLFLSAIGIKLNHPITNSEIEFNIVPPAKFKRILKSQQSNWEKHNIS